MPTASAQRREAHRQATDLRSRCLGLRADVARVAADTDLPADVRLALRSLLRTATRGLTMAEGALNKAARELASAAVKDDSADA